MPRTKNQAKIEVLDIKYHRNGVDGEPFYVVRFDDLTTPDIRPLIGIVYKTEKHVSVLDVKLLHEGDYGHDNSWRGCNFEKLLRDAITKHRGSAW